MLFIFKQKTAYEKRISDWSSDVCSSDLPLGIPSRMNIGQIFETLLGFVGTSLNTRYQILSFDECFGSNATKILLNQKLKEQKIKIRHKYATTNIDKNFVVDGDRKRKRLNSSH